MFATLEVLFRSLVEGFGGGAVGIIITLVLALVLVRLAVFVVWSVLRAAFGRFLPAQPPRGVNRIPQSHRCRGCSGTGKVQKYVPYATTGRYDDRDCGRCDGTGIDRRYWGEYAR